MKFKQFLASVGAMVALSAILVGPAKAASVLSYDSLTGSTFTGGGWQIGSVSNALTGGESLDGGTQFVAAATGYIDSLTLALYGATSGTVIIYTDNGSNQLGTAVETLSLSESTKANSLATGSYTSGKTLQKGQKYWVLAVGPTSGPLQTWNEFNYATPTPLYTLEGVTTPCCTSAVTTGYYTGVNSIDGFGMILTMASTVPEPATWTMLIAGFGMIGAAVRRKTRVLASA